MDFRVDRVSRGTPFSPSLVNVTGIFPMRGWRECLSPDRSGVEALGGKVSTCTHKRVFVISLLDLASTWPLLPFVLLFQSPHQDPQLARGHVDIKLCTAKNIKTNLDLLSLICCCSL